MISSFYICQNIIKICNDNIVKFFYNNLIDIALKTSKDIKKIKKYN